MDRATFGIWLLGGSSNRTLRPLCNESRIVRLMYGNGLNGVQGFRETVNALLVTRYYCVTQIEEILGLALSGPQSDDR